MFQNNPLLSQLKQQMRESKPRVEGSVKANEKGFGFLECDKKSYFITPPAMKKVMHGDKISAVIETNGDKEQAEPEALIEPMLTRFIAKVRFNKEKKLLLVVDHPNINNLINAVKAADINEELQEGDWVVAELQKHPLRDDRTFFAKVSQFICRADDHFAPWWVTLARHQQPRTPVAGLESYQLDESLPRQDLTGLDFVTIDAASTQDMDDALYIETTNNGWKLWVAIADPTAYIPLDSQIEQDARQRCFTNYLPGFNIPMLPRELSDELCSLVPQQQRPALVCTIETDRNGEITGEPHFSAAWIESKAKLDYDAVSDLLEQVANHWQPNDEKIAKQIELLHQFALARIDWRRTHALLFKERPDYSFELEQDGKVKAIHAKHRRIANQIVEEAMIIANTSAAQYLDQQAKCGIFNTHSGFDPKFQQAAHDFLLATLANDDNHAELAQRYSVENLTTLNGYCQMRHDIEQYDFSFLEMRLRRFLTFAEFKAEAAPHFGLGLPAYATWTSPIRKYSDMVNHRIIKQCLLNQSAVKPADDILARLQEARRQNRMVERDIADWLYSLYFAPLVEQQPIFSAEIQDVSRGGLRVQLLDNGASVFVPISTLHDKKEETSINSDELALYIKDQKAYQIGDQVQIKLVEVNVITRSLIGNVVLL
ncbi:exoribonuclease II [Testudinibacter sp. TR-2022]|uniref:exoribonuclease II n=1 Tax=Testudinibacter sp. TR-2022 TaxID=2585029 RepID=UPI001119E20E|nr:exoribonuclease II [Testudinibacter sp. TR-2022]TNH04659.1 exoribonuclease II [Pasteurellaceae bacterium Phil31]TNH07775.1 exoribonuclease II [Testudinibacter sp. TR-2022]TNH09125.1 exoribonuclease II [Testudinibacter sp. TR-2022]TNH15562.1 exoribonuclease II [Testudinibacter sp. TR-2022]TNH17067.1 exoribonuclease II [Testudinibacter sp. TR-2022]